MCVQTKSIIQIIQLIDHLKCIVYIQPAFDYWSLVIYPK